MVLQTFEEIMAKLSVEQLQEWAQFKEDLLKDKRLILALPKQETEIITTEVDAITYEIWRRKYQAVLDELHARFGNKSDAHEE